MHRLQKGDELVLQDGRFRVVRVAESRVLCAPANKTEVKMKDKRGKEHVFHAEGRTINIAPGYEGEAFRAGKKIRVHGSLPDEE